MSAAPARPASGLMIAAPGSGSGKTVVTLGLLRALRDRGAAVAAAKSGPDYIDPRFHEAACGGPSVNLDAWAMGAAELRARAAEHVGAQAAALLVVEAAMGLLDGAPDAGRAQGRGSAADLAAALGLPVVLVLDVARQAASAAAWPAGLAALRPDLRIAGVLLNKVGSPRHAALVSRALEAAGVAVLGAIPRDERLATPSRHLGLVQAEERADLEGFVAGAAAIVAEHTDLDRLQALAGPLTAAGDAIRRLSPLGRRLAVARDEAFAFLYPHHLTDWRAQGGEIAFFSPLADEAPAAEADAVFLPGGYPELHAGRLAAAEKFRTGMQAAAARGARIYGECGGYMTLGEALVDAEGAAHRMLGLLPLETSFAERRLTLGYRRLRPLGLFEAELAAREFLAAHEFHYATLRREGAADRLFEASDAEGAALPAMGLRRGAVSGSFAHVIGRAS